MKQLIILLLLTIVLLIGYGKYSQYKRYNSPEVNYKTEKKLDINYHNQETVMKYYEAIEDLDSYIMLQWTTNNIDVKTPTEDDLSTNLAVKTYAKKLAKVNYYEAILENSLQLKTKGISNEKIKFLEENGITLEAFKKKEKFEKIIRLFDSKINLYKKKESPLVYEVQKRLNTLGYPIEKDGVYSVETLNAIKKFEEKNNLLADGYIDALTLEHLFN